MPLYEYECQQCHRHTEKIQKFSDTEITVCPHCGGPLERVISAPAIAFKGGGWYADGYGNAKPKSGSGEGKGSESKGDSGGAEKTGESSGSSSKETAAAPAAGGSNSAPASNAAPASSAAPAPSSTAPSSDKK